MFSSLAIMSVVLFLLVEGSSLDSRSPKALPLSDLPERDTNLFHIHFESTAETLTQKHKFAKVGYFFKGKYRAFNQNIRLKDLEQCDINVHQSKADKFVDSDLVIFVRVTTTGESAYYPCFVDANRRVRAGIFLINPQTLIDISKETGLKFLIERTFELLNSSFHCPENFYIQDGVCLNCPKDPLSCPSLDCTSQCFLCERGYFHNGIECMRCPYRCTDCVSFYHCSECLDLSASPPGCCPVGQYHSNGTCKCINGKSAYSNCQCPKSQVFMHGECINPHFPITLIIIGPPHVSKSCNSLELQATKHVLTSGSSYRWSVLQENQRLNQFLRNSEDSTIIIPMKLLPVGIWTFRVVLDHMGYEKTYTYNVRVLPSNNFSFYFNQNSPLFIKRDDQVSLTVNVKNSICQEDPRYEWWLDSTKISSVRTIGIFPYSLPVGSYNYTVIVSVGDISQTRNFFLSVAKSSYEANSVDSPDLSYKQESVAVLAQNPVIKQSRNSENYPSISVAESSAGHETEQNIENEGESEIENRMLHENSMEIYMTNEPKGKNLTSKYMETNKDKTALVIPIEGNKLCASDKVKKMNPYRKIELFSQSPSVQASWVLKYEDGIFIDKAVSQEQMLVIEGGTLESGKCYVYEVSYIDIYGHPGYEEFVFYMNRGPICQNDSNSTPIIVYNNTVSIEGCYDSNDHSQNLTYYLRIKDPRSNYHIVSAFEAKNYAYFEFKLQGSYEIYAIVVDSLHNFSQYTLVHIHESSESTIIEDWVTFFSILILLLLTITIAFILIMKT